MEGTIGVEIRSATCSEDVRRAFDEEEIVVDCEVGAQNSSHFQEFGVPGLEYLDCKLVRYGVSIRELELK